VQGIETGRIALTDEIMENIANYLAITKEDLERYPTNQHFVNSAMSGNYQ